jgi:N-acetylmuramic acid 6-phosphate etherase
MVRLGKVHENLMVDLRATNEKLWDRGARIVGILTGLDRERSLELLKQAGGQVKVAVVMGRRSMGAAEASEMLRRHGGILRAALEK